MKSFIFKELSYKVLGLAFNVHNALGPGLKEDAYQATFVVELQEAGLGYEIQKDFPLHHLGRYVGAYIADIVIENTIILELKAVSQLTSGMSAQLVNYLKLSGFPVGYLLNFGHNRLEWHRFVNTGKGGP